MKATWAKPQVNESLISGKSVIHKTRFLYFFFGETGYDFFVHAVQDESVISKWIKFGLPIPQP